MNEHLLSPRKICSERGELRTTTFAATFPGYDFEHGELFYIVCTFCGSETALDRTAEGAITDWEAGALLPPFLSQHLVSDEAK